MNFSLSLEGILRAKFFIDNNTSYPFLRFRLEANVFRYSIAYNSILLRPNTILASILIL
jgi:hypothetical protein